MTALGTRLLQLTIAGTDYTAQVSNVEIATAASDSDFVTFADAAGGGLRDYTLNFTAVQDTATTTLWDRVWSNAGTTVTGLIKPAGGVASASNPHFSFSAVITEPDGTLLGGEANSSASARFTIECEWALTAKPVRVVA